MIQQDLFAATTTQRTTGMPDIVRIIAEGSVAKIGGSQR
jgi:hypothetical protein